MVIQCNILYTFLLIVFLAQLGKLTVYEQSKSCLCLRVTVVITIHNHRMQTCTGIWTSTPDNSFGKIPPELTPNIPQNPGHSCQSSYPDIFPRKIHLAKISLQKKAPTHSHKRSELIGCIATIDFLMLIVAF